MTVFLYRMLNKEVGKKRRPMIVILNIAAFVGQLTVLLVYPVAFMFLNNSPFDGTLLGRLQQDYYFICWCITL